MWIMGFEIIIFPKCMNVNLAGSIRLGAPLE